MFLRPFACAALVALLAGPAFASTISFTKQLLDTRFYSEGVAVAEVNHDGHPDVLAGPYWFEGPGFTRKHEMRAPLAYNSESYSDAFMMDAYDFDRDGRTDVLQVGWPGREALWFKNPGPAGGDWPRRVVFPSVGTESPTLLNLVGDGKPELVFSTAKKLGWAEPDPTNPEAPWKFHAITPEGEWQRYTHGLGVGDINGDGRADLLAYNGWWAQPPSLEGDPIWTYHAANFGLGGAQMYAYDVNGDGRADVITSIEGHKYGLSWFEQLPAIDGRVAWREHPITSRNPDERLQGVQFSQPHALVITDIDGDGLQDIITGKRFWAHGSKGDPEPNAPAVLHWFQLMREGGQVRYVPHLIDDASGVGTQFVVTDLNGDKLPDIAIANKRGVFVFLQHRYP